MTKQDVVSTSSIQGMNITQYLGMVSGRGASFDAALQAMANNASAMGANKVIGAYVDAVSARSYLAQGTAVVVA
jgi:uncharacterized protein YbjQ (UPF0145 family)